MEMLLYCLMIVSILLMTGCNKVNGMDKDEIKTEAGKVTKEFMKKKGKTYIFTGYDFLELDTGAIQVNEYCKEDKDFNRRVRMEKPKGYGTFSLRNENIFRDAAYIQWGDSEQSIGSCLLLNPGSSTLKEYKMMLERLSSSGKAEGEISLDPTMRQLVAFVEKIYETVPVLQGRLYVYNLFTLKNPRSTNAIEYYEEIAVRDSIHHPLPSIDELRTHPWILLAWGCNQKPKWIHLQQAKDKWLKLISESGIRAFGKSHNKPGKYYHPCPQLIKDREKIIKDLAIIYNKTI